MPDGFASESNSNHNSGSKCGPLITARCPIAPATRRNITGFHGDLSRAFDAEGASRAFALEGCAENIYVPPSRLVHQVLTHHGALLHANIRQRLPPISPSSHHHKLALPIEAVRTHASFSLR